MHGGGPPVTAGTPLAPEYKEENVDLIQKGVCNLVKHIENTAQYGVPVIVAINKFATDTDAEMEVIRTESLKAGETSYTLPLVSTQHLHKRIAESRIESKRDQMLRLFVVAALTRHAQKMGVVEICFCSILIRENFSLTSVLGDVLGEGGCRQHNKRGMDAHRVSCMQELLMLLYASTMLSEEKVQ